MYDVSINPRQKVAMPRIPTAGTFEECADELNDFINTMERYPHTVLAFALRAHITGLLQVLVLNGLWTRDEVAAFMEEMQEQALHPDGRL
jgi:hypothetical protein